MKKMIILLVAVVTLLVTGTANMTVKAYKGAYEYAEFLNGTRIGMKENGKTVVYETIVEVEGHGIIWPTFDYGEYIIDNEGMIHTIREFSLDTLEAVAKGL